MIRPDEEVSLSLTELDHILGLQRSICSLIASDTPYLDVITETCRVAERLLPGAVNHALGGRAGDCTVGTC